MEVPETAVGVAVADLDLDIGLEDGGHVEVIDGLAY